MEYIVEQQQKSSKSPPSCYMYLLKLCNIQKMLEGDTNYWKKRAKYIYETFFYIHLTVTTQKKKKKSRAVKYNIKKETEGKIIKYHNTKITDSNQKTKKQWATRKQKIERL